MKHSRFSGTFIYTLAVILLAACGSAGNEKTEATDSTAASDSMAKARAINTIVTTPQYMLLVKHKVANYDKWLIAYDAHDSFRLASGLHSYVIGRGMPDSNMVMVAVKVDDTAKAKAFGKSPGLKMAMQKSGVIGIPTISITAATWQDTALIAPALRSMTSITVKDWDVFLREFENGRGARSDNGIIDRVVGHDLDDNKKVFIVTALKDTARAFAYYKSDEMKKRREAAGVIGEPVRFFFWIVKRY